MLSEHAKLGDPTKVDDDQSPEDRQCVAKVLKEFEKLKKHRSKYDYNWLHYYKMWRGDQWDGIKMPKHRQRECINMIWQTVQANMPLQTDARPRIQFVAEEPSDIEFANVLNEVMEADWERGNWLVPLSEIILDGYIYGTGYGSLVYDQEADFGMGSAQFESEDPFYLYPDNEAREINDNRSKIFIKAEPVDTDSLKREFPEFEDKIKSDIDSDIQSSKTSLNDYTARTSNSDRDMPDVSFLTGKQKTTPRTMLITAWMKPDETEEVESEEIGENGEIQNKVIIKKVYPFGRVIKIANGLKIFEGTLTESGRFPFMKYVNYMLPREFFGVSEVEQLESPQRVFNKILNAAIEIMNLMGNPIWVISTDSGIDPNKLINRTGLVVEKEPGSEVRREHGVELNSTIFPLLDRLESWFDKIGGNQEVSRGQAPASITASSAIEQLMDAARTRIKQKQRNLDAMVRDMGRQYVDIVLENYTQSRVFRVTNDQTGTKYFKFRVDKVLVDGKTQLVGKIRNYIQNDGESIAMSDEEKEFFISGRFDVKVNTGTSLPFAVADKENKSFALFDRGIIDEEEVLNNIEYPNKEQVIQKLMERKAAMQQQKAAEGA
jgi:hypothetical protein